MRKKIFLSSCRRILKKFPFKTFFLNFLSSLSVIWLPTEFTLTFVKAFEKAVHFKIWYFAASVVIALFWAIYKSWPRHSFTCKVKNRDVNITLKVGDVFKDEGYIVVPINDKFNSHLNGNVLKLKSVQSRLIKDFFHSDPALLTTKIQQQLQQPIYDSYKYADLDGSTRYQMGTIACVEIDDRIFFLVVNSKVRQDNDSRVFSTRDDLDNTLANLWMFASSNCHRGNIAMPVIGTGNARSPVPRDQVVKEVIKSFLASCSEGNYCNRLTIYIYPDDFADNKIDFDELCEFITYQCKYTEFDMNRPSHNMVSVNQELVKIDEKTSERTKTKTPVNKV